MSSILALMLRTFQFVYALKMMLAGVEVNAETAEEVNGILSTLPEDDIALLIEVATLL